MSRVGAGALRSRIVWSGTGRLEGEEGIVRRQGPGSWVLEGSSWHDHVLANVTSLGCLQDGPQQWSPMER